VTIYYSKNSAGLRLQSCGMNCQFPYKRSIICQCLKINWNNICCYYINSIYNVCVFLLLLLFFCVYYCNVMSAWSGQDVSFLFFVFVEPMAFLVACHLTNKYACLLDIKILCVRLSVCLSVRYFPVLYGNGLTYCYIFSPNDSKSF